LALAGSYLFWPGLEKISAGRKRAGSKGGTGAGSQKQFFRFGGRTKIFPLFSGKIFGNKDIFMFFLKVFFKVNSFIFFYKKSGFIFDFKKFFLFLFFYGRALGKKEKEKALPLPSKKKKKKKIF
jgi:hypothetical protein